jgi:HEAT repeat protein
MPTMSLTPESVAQLLSSDDYGNRLSGINQLRQLEPAIAFALIQPLITDAHARVRYAAVSQLASLGQQDKALALTLLTDRLVNDPEIDVKAAAADSLGGLKLTEAYPDLAHLYYQSTEWLLQFSIVAALGELGDPRGFDLLKDALSSPVELVQTAAIVALGELGDERGIALITSFLSHPDWQIRYRVTQALERFERSAVAQALEILSQDGVEQVAQEAQRVLSSGS